MARLKTIIWVVYASFSYHCGLSHLESSAIHDNYTYEMLKEKVRRERCWTWPWRFFKIYLSSFLKLTNGNALLPPFTVQWIRHTIIFLSPDYAVPDARKTITKQSQILDSSPSHAYKSGSTPKENRNLNSRSQRKSLLVLQTGALRALPLNILHFFNMLLYTHRPCRDYYGRVIFFTTFLFFKLCLSVMANSDEV